ncbi:MAG: radical SAM protein [Promethearchaeia archaeon]
MEILYINPPKLDSGLDSIIKSPPLSLISLAAMVPEHGAELFDFKVDDYNEKRFRSQLNRSDVVAITSMTPQIYQALDVAEMAKEHGCTTILGGYHPTLAPEFVAKDESVDFTVRGEGENTFKEIIDFLESEQQPEAKKKDIAGISYKNDEGNIRHNQDRGLEPNLDNFPKPRRDLLDMSKYVYLGSQVATLETSRGCPHNCKFCCIAKMWKDSRSNLAYRTKSLKRIMREIYDIDWKNDFIFFCEDNFTILPKRTKKILEAVKKSGIHNKIKLSCQSRIDTLYRNPWIIDLMDETNMRQVFLGIESVHQQSLNAMNKQNTTPEMTRKVVSMLHDRGISIFGGIIIGYPGETKRMVRETIQFARSLNLTLMQFTPITAFPGTEFYDEMKEADKITTHNYKYYDLFHPMMETDKLNKNEIWRLVAEAYGATYLDKEWMKTQAKRYLNPFGKFRWMLGNLPKFIKEVMRTGMDMLHTQGITGAAVSDEMKKLMKFEHIEEVLKYQAEKQEEDFMLEHLEQAPKIAK